VAFLDKAPNKQGLQLDGLPILAPEQGLREHPEAASSGLHRRKPASNRGRTRPLEPGHTRSLHFITETA
jgi:hypothetical protein